MRASRTRSLSLSLSRNQKETSSERRQVQGVLDRRGCRGGRRQVRGQAAGRRAVRRQAEVAVAGQGISGLAVAAAGAGAMLAWSGIRGTRVTVALREILGGQQPSGHLD